MSNTTDTNHGIPLGVAQVTLILLRRALDERNRMIQLGARTPGMSLWLTPDGRLVYKKLKKRSIKVSRKKRQELLIHEFRGANPGRPALISRLICWVVDGHCSALTDLLSEADCADAYCRGFFHAIQDAAACEKGKQAVMNITKRKLLEKATRPPSGRVT
ncbi:MAG: hypothetical protein KBF26_01330 [Opitutaceae bacterium]|nr:hypothetical protein [Opitutaceae bacterium]